MRLAGPEVIAQHRQDVHHMTTCRLGEPSPLDGERQKPFHVGALGSSVGGIRAKPQAILQSVVGVGLGQGNEVVAES